MKLFLLLFLLSLNASADLIKINQFGDTLPATSTDWACVLDDKTQLMWEVKTTDETLYNTSNTYTWYNKISGVSNGEYSHNCSFYDFCNTSLFIELVNEFKLCGYGNWRLPIHQELKSLIKYPDSEPLIDTTFFPNTQSGRYWTSTVDVKDSSVIKDVSFFYGGTSGSEKSFDSFIRVVRKINQ